MVLRRALVDERAVEALRAAVQAVEQAKAKCMEADLKGGSAWAALDGAVHGLNYVVQVIQGRT